MEPKITEITNTIHGEDYIFKIVIVGDSGVGKSNILSRFTQNEFHQESKATVGVELQSKVYNIDGKIIKMQLWDTAGQERYKSITAAYFKGAKGAMIVYDITKQDSFNNVDKWYQQVKENGDSEIVIVQVGNKCDLKQNRQVTTDSGKEKARLNGKYYQITFRNAFLRNFRR
jgi:Ras-related protein Rab-11A